MRKDHTSGWKHAKNVSAHYLSLNQDVLNRKIAEIAKDYQARGELVPVPAAVQYKSTQMPMPMINSGGSTPQQSLQYVASQQHSQQYAPAHNAYSQPQPQHPYQR